MAIRLLPRDFFFGVVIFTIIVSSITGILALVIGGSNPGTDASVDPTAVPDLLADSGSNATHFDSVFNVEEDIINASTSLHTTMKELSVDNPNAFTVSVALIGTAWEGIRFIVTGFGFMNKAIEGMSGFLGLPVWVPVLIITLIVLFFVFTLLSVIFGKDL